VKALLLAVACLGAGQPPAGEPPLTNAAILELVESGMADDVVARLIASRENAFDVSVPGLVALKSAGVSSTLIRAMLSASDGRTSGVRTSPMPASVPDEQGVYWEHEGQLQRLPVEVTGLRGPRGFETDTGTIAGTRSRLVLDVPATFVIRTPDGVVADEYILVQLFIRDDRREFRTLTGSMWRGDGIERMAVPFESERLGANLYRVHVVALPNGEFGFLEPGTQLPIGTALARPEAAAGVPVRPLGPPPGTTAQRRADRSAGPIFTFGVH
jgi:hypothetical protein